MKKYYKQLNENNEIVALFGYEAEPNITDDSLVEITEEEFEEILAIWSENRRSRAEAEFAEIKAKMKESALKAKAYDIITGVE